MKKEITHFNYSLIRVCAILAIIAASLFLSETSIQAQIYEPEGINMPGAWNGWTNPPTNNLALASSTQVPNGRIAKVATGTLRYQTSFSVAATGADLIGGTYEWLFTSGPVANPWANKWSNVNVVMNTLQLYTKEAPTNNNITLVNNKWYTVIFEDLGYVSSRAIFMETDAQPVNILTVSVPGTVIEGIPAPVNVTVSQTPSPQELFYIRYTTDAWTTSAALPLTMTGTTGTVSIPGQPVGSLVQYYAFSSTVAAVNADYDLVSIKINNNSGSNYSYTVVAAPPTISWANLQWPENGEIEPLADFDVFGQAFINGITGQPTPAPGLQAWVGYSTTNSDPSTWTNWIPAPYNAPSGNNDEFKANLGALMTTEGIYYYATRFQLNTGAYVYGGFSVAGGGFWDGVTNVSGILSVSYFPSPLITWANLQWPENGIIPPSGDFDVYGQAYIEGITGQPTPAPGLTAWVGYSTNNTDPATWTDWITADYNAPAGNNDEFKANLGAALPNEGTYYYVTRFRYNSGDYVYGGFSVTGGGFWDGLLNVSGVLSVSVGLEEMNESVSVYPNPTTGLIFIQFPLKTSVSVSDMNGRTLLKQEIEAGQHAIDLSGFKAGIYHLQILTGEKILHRSIVKR